MNNSLMKILAFILFALTLTSCCKSKQIGTIRFSESDLIVNPYTGDETLQFIDDRNNMITYNNGERSSCSGHRWKAGSWPMGTDILR